MKIFVAGATGALGKPLVTQLVKNGHEVTGMTRSESKLDVLRDLGARPVVADALDPDAVARAVAEADPDVIVHQLTAIGAIERSTRVTWSATSPSRTGCAPRARTICSPPGVRLASKRFVAQSFAGWPYARDGRLG